jgi:hypothetical protein
MKIPGLEPICCPGLYRNKKSSAGTQKPAMKGKFIYIIIEDVK